MHLLNLYPLKGSFKPGEEILFKLVVAADGWKTAEIQLLIFHLGNIIDSIRQPISLQSGQKNITLSCQP